MEETRPKNYAAYHMHIKTSTSGVNFGLGFAFPVPSKKDTGCSMYADGRLLKISAFRELHVAIGDNYSDRRHYIIKRKRGRVYDNLRRFKIMDKTYSVKNVDRTPDGYFNIPDMRPRILPFVTSQEIDPDHAQIIEACLKSESGFVKAERQDDDSLKITEIKP